MEKSKTKMLVEAGQMIALAQILSYFKITQLPYGGSVTAGSMVPIIIFAIRWGVKEGVLAAIAYGILQFILGGSYSVHWFSLIVDFPIAFGFLGLAGLFRRNKVGILIGTTLGIAGRFLAHFISGVVAYGQYTPEGQSVWAYSLGYNASYMLPELIVSFLFLVLLYKYVTLDNIKL